MCVTRGLGPGDVLLPYTGEYFRTRAGMLQGRQTGSPYGYQLQGPGAALRTRRSACSRGAFVDGSCTRGLGNYANQAVRGSTTNNVQAKQVRISPGDVARSFADPTQPPGPNELPSYRAVPGARYRQAGFRRIPSALLEHYFTKRSYMWFVATRRIPRGSEVFINYKNPCRGCGACAGSLRHINRVKHRTRPKMCR